MKRYHSQFDAAPTEWPQGEESRPVAGWHRSGPENRGGFAESSHQTPAFGQRADAQTSSFVGGSPVAGPRYDRYALERQRSDVDTSPVQRYNADVGMRSVEQRRVEIERRPVEQQHSVDVGRRSLEQRPVDGRFNTDLGRRSMEQRPVEIERRPADNYNAELERRLVEQRRLLEQRRTELERRPAEHYRSSLAGRSVEQSPIELERRPVNNYNVDFQRRSVEQSRVELERRPAGYHTTDLGRRSLEQSPVQLGRRPADNYSVDLERRSVELRRIELERRPIEHHNVDLPSRSVEQRPMDLERRSSLQHFELKDLPGQWRRPDPEDQLTKRRRVEIMDQGAQAKHEIVPKLMRLAGCTDDRRQYTQRDDRGVERNYPEVVPRLMELAGCTDERQQYTKRDDRQVERKYPEVVPRLMELAGCTDERQQYTKRDDRQAEKKYPEVVPRLMKLAGCTDDRQQYTKRDDQQVERKYPEVVPRLMKLAGCLDDRQGSTEYNDRRMEASRHEVGPRHAGPLEDRHGFARHDERLVETNRHKIVPGLVDLAGYSADERHSQREVHLPDRHRIQREDTYRREQGRYNPEPERHRLDQDRYHPEPERHYPMSEDRLSVWHRLEPEGPPAERNRPPIEGRPIERQWAQFESQPARQHTREPVAHVSDLLFNNIQNQLMIQNVQSELTNLNRAYTQGQTDLGLFGQGQLLDITSADVQRTLMGLNESGYLDQLMNVNLQDILTDLNIANVQGRHASAPNGNAYHRATGPNRSNFKMGPIQLRGARSSKQARQNNLRTQMKAFPMTRGARAKTGSPATRGGGVRMGGSPMTGGRGAKTGFQTTRGGGASMGFPTTRGGRARMSGRGRATGPLLTLPNNTTRLFEKRQAPGLTTHAESDSESEEDSDDVLVDPTECFPGRIVRHGIKPTKKTQRKWKWKLMAGIVSFVADGKEEKGKFIEEECISGGLRLRTIRRLTGNPRLRLPMMKGMAVGVIARRPPPPSRSLAHQAVKVVLPGVPPGKGEKLDGLETPGTVVASWGRRGTALFGSPARRARFETQRVVLAGLVVPPPAHPHVLYPGLGVTLAITMSIGGSIPGVQYMAEASVAIPLEPEPAPQEETNSGTTSKEVETISLSSGPPDKEETHISLSSGPMEDGVETVSLSPGVMIKEEATVSLSPSPMNNGVETISLSSGPTNKEVETISLSPGPPDQEEANISLSSGPMDEGVETVCLSPVPTDKEEATVCPSPRPTSKEMETIPLSPKPMNQEEATISLSPGTIDQKEESILLLSPEPQDQVEANVSLSSETVDKGVEIITLSPRPMDQEEATMSIPTGPPDKEAATTALSSPGQLEKEVENISVPPGPSNHDQVNTSLSGNTNEGVETISLSPRPTDKEVDVISLPAGAMDQEEATKKEVETISLSPRPADNEVEVISPSPVMPPLRTPYALAGKPELFNAVVLAVTDGRPALLACVNKAARRERFFVHLSRATIARGPITRCPVHLGTGARAVCALSFARGQCEVRSGCVYPATAHFPLARATVESVRVVDGMAIPHTLSFVHEGERCTVALRRRDFRVEGERPGPSFPRDFFRVGSRVDINDYLERHGREPAATLDLSANALTPSVRRTRKTRRKKKVDASKIVPKVATAKVDVPKIVPNVAASKIVPKVATSKIDVPKIVPKIAASKVAASGLVSEGQISALQENADGMVTPTEAWTTIGGKRTPVHLSVVFVNGRRGAFVPPTLFKLGDRITLHAIRFCAIEKRFTAEARRQFARRVFKRACDEHLKSLELTTRPEVVIAMGGLVE